MKFYDQFFDGNDDDDDDDDNDDENSENEGGENVDEDDDDSDDDMDNIEDGNNNEESSDDGDDDSEGETLDAQLGQVLQARRASAKALKSPGAKRNWKVAHSKKGKRSLKPMPKFLPIPSKRRK